jgi:hypothetical protein
VVGKHHNAKIFGPGVLFVVGVQREYATKGPSNQYPGVFLHSAALRVPVTLLARHRSKIEQTNLPFREHGSALHVSGNLNNFAGVN